MPTIVAAADRKLTFRKRVRLNKAEEKAANALLDLWEKFAADYERGDNGGDIIRLTDSEYRSALAATGCRKLGNGIDKVAFALPGDRYVIKVPRTVHDFTRNRERFMKHVTRRLTSEARIYTNVTPETREVLAAVRVIREYATVQEFAGTPLAHYHGSRTIEFRRAVDRAIKVGTNAGIGDLHDGNLAVREDGTVCIIDFSR